MSDDFAAQLQRRERLVWSGRPAPARFRQGQLFLAIFMVIFTAFAGFWTGGAWMQGPWPFALFGLPFLGVGFFSLWNLVKQRGVADRLRYAATNQRLLILDRRTKPPRLHAYVPGQFAELRRVEGAEGTLDLYFAADTGVDGWMPPVGGKSIGPLSLVGFVGVEPAAERAVKAVLALPAPRDPLPLREAPDAPARGLEASGSLRTFWPKLRARVAEHRAHEAKRRARGRTRFWLIATPIVLLPGGLSLFSNDPFALLPGTIFTLAFAGIAAAVRHFLMNAGQQRTAAHDRGEALARLLDTWAADVHPKSPLTGFVDLGNPHDAPPYRTANSLSSNRLKTAHRHRWARLTFATACGSTLSVSFIDKFKLKSGVQTAQQTILTGYLLLNPQVWEPVDPEALLTTDSLTVDSVAIGGRHVLVFHATLTAVADAEEAIGVLYAELTPRQPVP